MNSDTPSTWGEGRQPREVSVVPTFCLSALEDSLLSCGHRLSVLRMCQQMWPRALWSAGAALLHGEQGQSSAAVGVPPSLPGQGRAVYVQQDKLSWSRKGLFLVMVVLGVHTPALPGSQRCPTPAV